MKIYHVLPLLLMIIISSCSKENQQEEINQEELMLETRRASRDCTPSDIPCSNIFSSLKLLVGKAPAGTEPYIGLGTSGILDDLLNCTISDGVFCYRNCQTTIDIVPSLEYLGCVGGDGELTSEEQIAIIEDLKIMALANTLICPIDGTQMIPINYDVYAYTWLNPSVLKLKVTYVSACTDNPSLGDDGF